MHQQKPLQHIVNVHIPPSPENDSTADELLFLIKKFEGKDPTEKEIEIALLQHREAIINFNNWIDKFKSPFLNLKYYGEGI